jgi:hypothetical protein
MYLNHNKLNLCEPLRLRVLVAGLETCHEGSKALRFSKSVLFYVNRTTRLFGISHAIAYTKPIHHFNQFNHFNTHSWQK